MDQLQQLFYESAIEKMLVQINLEDNKVYIGWIRSLPPATESAAGYFLILPLKSGYRDEKSRELVLTTDYSGVLIELNQTSSDAADLNDKLELYYKVIRTSCISLASRFNSEEFDKFSHNRQIVLS